MPYVDPEKGRECRRRRYERLKEAILDDSRLRRDAARIRNRAYVISVKAGAVCADCKQSHPPCVLQFDHVNGNKSAGVAQLAHAPVSLARLQWEIMKCEIVCANCHAVRTFTRLQQREAEA